LRKTKDKAIIMLGNSFSPCQFQSLCLN